LDRKPVHGENPNKGKVALFALDFEVNRHNVLARHFEMLRKTGNT
jgi:hypothetical protein